MIGEATMEALRRDPDGPQRGVHAGAPFAVKIEIPHYRQRVERHYADLLPSGLAVACERFAIPFGFDHFGLIVEFERPVELAVFDAANILDADLRRAIGLFGPVVIRNAHLPVVQRGKCQHNIFADLRFHFDRGPNQPNQLSLYTRDCSDPAQRAPRTTSTVFVANIVAHLQHLREAKDNAGTDPGRVQPSYDIFGQDPLMPLIGDIVLEQPWTAETTAGELAMIDNRTVLHASYYRGSRTPGYPIGTRYLS